MARMCELFSISAGQESGAPELQSSPTIDQSHSTIELRLPFALGLQLIQKPRLQDVVLNRSS